MNDRKYNTDDLITRAVATQYLGVTGTTFDKWRKRGEVPAAVTAPGGYPRWRFGDIKNLKDTLTKAGVLPIDVGPIDIGSKDTPPDAMASRADCARFAGINVVTWDAWVSKGRAPMPVRIGKHPPHWRVGDLRDFFKLGGTE